MTGKWKCVTSPSSLFSASRRQARARSLGGCAQILLLKVKNLLNICNKKYLMMHSKLLRQQRRTSITSDGEEAVADLHNLKCDKYVVIL